MMSYKFQRVKWFQWKIMGSVGDPGEREGTYTL